MTIKPWRLQNFEDNKISRSTKCRRFKSHLQSFSTKHWNMCPVRRPWFLMGKRFVLVIFWRKRREKWEFCNLQVHPESGFQTLEFHRYFIRLWRRNTLMSSNIFGVICVLQTSRVVNSLFLFYVSMCRKKSNLNRCLFSLSHRYRILKVCYKCDDIRSWSR